MLPGMKSGTGVMKSQSPGRGRQMCAQDLAWHFANECRTYSFWASLMQTEVGRNLVSLQTGSSNIGRCNLNLLLKALSAIEP